MGVADAQALTPDRAAAGTWQVFDGGRFSTAPKVRMRSVSKEEFIAAMASLALGASLSSNLTQCSPEWLAAMGGAPLDGCVAGIACDLAGYRCAYGCAYRSRSRFARSRCLLQQGLYIQDSGKNLAMILCEITIKDTHAYAAGPTAPTI